MPSSGPIQMPPRRRDRPRLVLRTTPTRPTLGTMSEESAANPYAIPLDALEDAVRVRLDDQVEEQPDQPLRDTGWAENETVARRGLPAEPERSDPRAAPRGVLAGSTVAGEALAEVIDQAVAGLLDHVQCSVEGSVVLAVRIRNVQA